MHIIYIQLFLFIWKIDHINVRFQKQKCRKFIVLTNLYCKSNSLYCLRLGHVQTTSEIIKDEYKWHYFHFNRLCVFQLQVSWFHYFTNKKIIKFTNCTNSRSICRHLPYGKTVLRNLYLKYLNVVPNDVITQNFTEHNTVNRTCNIQQIILFNIYFILSRAFIMCRIIGRICKLQHL